MVLICIYVTPNLIYSNWVPSANYVSHI